MGKESICIPKNELEDLYLNKKLTTYQISGKYNCCQATIGKRLKQFKIKSRKPYELYSNVPSKKELIDLYIKKRLSTWEIEKRYGYSRGTSHRKLREYGIKTRDRAESHIIYPRKDFSGDMVEKAYLIGFRIGDLRVRKIWENSDTILIDCGSTINEQLNLIENLFKRYGKVWISKPNKCGKRQIEARLNSTFSFLLTKEVPNWIFEREEHFFPFLAGFIDAEGCIKIYNDQAILQIGNYDKPLLDLIIKTLYKFGIECKGPYESKIKGRICIGGYRHNRNYFQIRILKKSVLLRLIRILKPYTQHENKRKDFKKAEINILERNKLYGE